MICQLCGESIGPDDDYRGINSGHQSVHRECMLQVALGGIGHLEDHDYWCLIMGDPYGARSKRQSGIEVDRWVSAHGLADGER